MCLEHALGLNLGGRPAASLSCIAALEGAAPDAAGTITAAPAELPFPSEIAHDALTAALGPVPVTPYRDGIAATVEILRRLQTEGRLVGIEQGLPAAEPSPA